MYESTTVLRRYESTTYCSCRSTEVQKCGSTKFVRKYLRRHAHSIYFAKKLTFVQAHAPSLRRSTKNFVPMSSIMQLMPSTSFAILEGRQSGFLTPLLLKKSAVLKLPTDPRTKQIFRPLDALNALKKTKKKR